MGKVQQKFQELRKNNQKAFIPFITFGYPTINKSIDIFHLLGSLGVDVIELGVPFSDPIADGLVIQQASYQALTQGVNLPMMFSFLHKELRNFKVPVVFMSYYNPIYHLGEKKFFSLAKDSGLAGVIVPDLLVDYSQDFVKIAKNKDIDTNFFVSSDTSNQRITLVDKASTGFIYYLSVKGITGMRKTFSKDIFSKIKTIKTKVKNPVCVGFGISDRSQVLQFNQVADGVIVGSAIVKKICLWQKDKNMLKKLREFILWLKG